MAKKSNGPKCAECGKALNKVSTTMADCNGYPLEVAGRGHKANGIFCTANCGFSWAVRWASKLYFWR